MPLHDATADILAARSASGYTGDDAPALNAVLSVHRAIQICPEVGSIACHTEIFAPLVNQMIVCQGGLQAIPWIRSPSHVGSTLVVGSRTSPTGGAGACHLENLWFVHPDRLGWYASNPEGTPLPNKLTANQSHLEIHGAQNAYVKVGGYGCPHFASVFGGAGVLFDQPFIYGGMWDPEYPAVQEGISQIRFTSSPVHGHGTNHTVRTPHMYGGNATAARNVIVGSKVISTTQRVGPLYGVLVESCEDFEIDGGFSAGYAHSNIAVISTASGILMNGIIRGTKIDESNENGIYTYRGNQSRGYLNCLIISNTIFNGQTIGKRAINFDGYSGNVSVQRVIISDVISRAHTFGAFMFSGVNGGQVRSCRLAGYNMAMNDPTHGDSNGGAGFIIDANTKNVSVGDIIYGGGINDDEETNTPTPSNPTLSPNATQFGLIDATTGKGNSYFRQRKLNFGLPGGVVVLGGVPDPP